MSFSIKTLWERSFYVILSFSMVKARNLRFTIDIMENVLINKDMMDNDIFAKDIPECHERQNAKCAFY